MQINLLNFARDKLLTIMASNVVQKQRRVSKLIKQPVKQEPQRKKKSSKDLSATKPKLNKQPIYNVEQVATPKETRKHQKIF